MKAIDTRVSDIDPNLTTQSIISGILEGGNPRGRSITDMATYVALIHKIRDTKKGQKILLSDSEYDKVKQAYEANQFPLMNQIFLDIWKDITEYTSVPDPKSPAKKETNANKD